MESGIRKRKRKRNTESNINDKKLKNFTLHNLVQSKENCLTRRNHVRPDLPNKQEEIHMQYTAVERLFYLHHDTSGSILYSNRVVLFLLLILSSQKKLTGLERRLICLWLIKINSTLNSSVSAPPIFLTHDFPTLIVGYPASQIQLTAAKR